jgi:SnoaL-like domain
MLANWEAMLAGIPDFCAEICGSVQDGDTTWTEWRWSGSRSDGQAFEMRGVTLFEVAGGQIVAGRLYLEDVEPDVVSIEQAVEDLSGRRPRSAHSRTVQPSASYAATQAHLGALRRAVSGERKVGDHAWSRRCLLRGRYLMLPRTCSWMMAATCSSSLRLSALTSCACWSTDSWCGRLAWGP